MVRIRDDDVLVHSSGFKNSFDRFKMVHEIIVNNRALHVPAILTKEIQDFPEAIKFIRNEREAGRMEVQWHGMNHVDYAKKTLKEIVDDILDSLIFFKDNFGVGFNKFYTPWGANAGYILTACRSCGIEMIDCSNIIRCVHVNRNSNKYKGKDVEIMIHWWEGVGRLRNALKNLKE